MDPRLYRIRLASVASARPPFPTRSLFHVFGTPERILNACPSKLARVEGIRPSIVQSILAVREGSGDEEDILALTEKSGIRILSYEEADYPENLRWIPDPPAVLFVKGLILPQDRAAMAVIGSRKASAYGVSACEQFVEQLVRNGFCVVSGMAKGIDAVAHWRALECGGRTLGVLGTGPEAVYPKANKALFEKVLEGGALLSEFLPGTGPRPENFPRRNRIISGLAWGVLVVEASVRSGTMITVRMALEQGREVFAVPGDVRSSLSRGTHRLIKQGAKLVDEIEDILQEIPWCHRKTVGPFGDRERGSFRVPRTVNGPHGEKVQEEGAIVPTGEDKDVETLLSFVDDKGVLMDTLVHRTGWTMEKVTSLLTVLELFGSVKRLPGSRVARKVRTG